MANCPGFYVHSEWEKRKRTETPEEFNKKNFDQVEKMMADPHVSYLVRYGMWGEIHFFVFNIKCYIFHLIYRDMKKLLSQRFDTENMDETKKEKYRVFEVIYI